MTSHMHCFALALVAGCALTDPPTSESAQLARVCSQFETVDFPGAIRTLVLGLDDRGRYAGLFVTTAAHAMWFDGHALATLDPDSIIGTSPRSRAYALNNLGAVVGSYSDAAGRLHGYVVRGSTATTIDHPSGEPTEVFGINDLGRMIGVHYDSDGSGHGFALTDGVFRDIEVPGSVSTVPLSINDRGEVVGEVIDVAGTVGHGYRQARDGAITRYDAPAAPPDSTYFISINNRHQILGAYFDESFELFNFVLDHGAATPFALPASFDASTVTAQTINDLGEIVGYYSDAGGATHGFIARP